MSSKETTQNLRASNHHQNAALPLPEHTPADFVMLGGRFTSTLQMQLQQVAVQSEQEVQQIYAKEMESLIKKMKAISGELGQSKELDLVLETTESGIVYQGPSVLDLTPEVIKMYDARHP